MKTEIWCQLCAVDRLVYSLFSEGELESHRFVCKKCGFEMHIPAKYSMQKAFYLASMLDIEL